MPDDRIQLNFPVYSVNAKLPNVTSAIVKVEFNSLGPFGVRRAPAPLGGKRTKCKALYPLLFQMKLGARTKHRAKSFGDVADIVKFRNVF